MHRSLPGIINSITYKMRPEPACFSRAALCPPWRLSGARSRLTRLGSRTIISISLKRFRVAYDSYHKRFIGQHELAPETQMMGYGYDAKLSEGSLKPPIFLTSTFVFRTAQDGKDFFDFTAGRREPPAGQTS